MSSFADKVAVVTGAGRGIGLAIARRLADGGAKVAIISARKPTAARLRSPSTPRIRTPPAPTPWTWPTAPLSPKTAKQIIADFGKVDTSS